jgi:hypothetical protein
MMVSNRRVAAAALLAAACSSDRVAPPPTPPVNWGSLERQSPMDAGPDAFLSEKERELPVAFANALASPGFAQLGHLLDEDAHFAFPGMDDAHGRTSIVRAFEVTLGAFEQRQLQRDRVWRTPNEQTIEWTLSGTLARDWMGVSATHTAATFKLLTLLWTKDDGTISDVHMVFDVAAVKAMMGAGPKGLTAPPSPVLGKEEPKIYVQGNPPTDAEKSNVAAYEAQLDAFEGSNLQKYLDAMTDDVEVFTAERAAPARGKDEAKAYFKAMHKAIGQLDTTVENAWGVTEHAVVEYFIAGEQLGAIGWVPAQRDRVIRLQVVDIAEIQGGKIRRVWRYDNPLQLVATAP